MIYFHIFSQLKIPIYLPTALPDKSPKTRSIRAELRLIGQKALFGQSRLAEKLINKPYQVKIMIINVKDNWVDFDKPVRMTERQIKDFKKFIQEEFNTSEIKYVKEKEPNREGIEVHQKKWEAWEMVALFSGEDTPTLEKKLNRNSMSIQMMGQKIVFEVLAWAKKRGRAIPP